MQISDKCYGLAGSLFSAWALMNAARRYAAVEEKEKALMASVNAKAAIYDCEKDASLSPEEAKAVNDDLTMVINGIEWRKFSESRDRLEALSEQFFMRSLEKIVDCECLDRR